MIFIFYKYKVHGQLMLEEILTVISPLIYRWGKYSPSSQSWDQSPDLLILNVLLHHASFFLSSQINSLLQTNNGPKTTIFWYMVMKAK